VKFTTNTGAAKTVVDNGAGDADARVGYYKVTMGELMLLRKPGIAVSLYYNGALTVGQTIKVTGPNGYAKTMIDGTATDVKSNGTQGPADGKFEFQVPSTGTYTVCTMSAPQMYWDAGCSPVYVIYHYVQFPITMAYQQKSFIPKS
jgi:hypothetical protein